MNNNCKYLKQGFGKLKCAREKNHTIEINFADCKNCKYKEYKEINKLKATTPLKAKTKLKQRTSKQAKLERERISIFTDDLTKCYFCPNKKDHLHEVYCGRNRKNSMRYGLCLPICESCHSKYQNDAKFNAYWHVLGQKKFIECYPTLAFESVFKINYL